MFFEVNFSIFQFNRKTGFTPIWCWWFNDLMILECKTEHLNYNFYETKGKGLNFE